jgi:hypothetical protein
MHKVSRKIMVMLYESCSVFYNESNKIEFAFFLFFFIFYGFSKFQPNANTIWESTFQTGPWKIFQVHKYAPVLRIGP